MFGMCLECLVIARFRIVLRLSWLNLFCWLVFRLLGEFWSFEGQGSQRSTFLAVSTYSGLFREAPQDSRIKGLGSLKLASRQGRTRLLSEFLVISLVMVLS